MLRGIVFLMSFAVYLSVNGAMVRTQAESRNFEQFPLATPGVTPEMLYAGFGMARAAEADAGGWAWAA